MEVPDDLGQIDDLVCKMLGHAVMAKAYGDAISRDPDVFGGFGKLAERHRAAVAGLCDEIKDAATRFTGAGDTAEVIYLAGESVANGRR
jgi:hypothetical protein